MPVMEKLDEMGHIVIMRFFHIIKAFGGFIKVGDISN